VKNFLKITVGILLITGFLFSQSSAPVKYWESLSKAEKIAFVNGAYGAIAKLKQDHKHEVRKQYNQDPNWVQPYYIERFYEIADEYLSQEIGYYLEIIVDHMDALYSNYDNAFIPVIESLRIVSLAQDDQNSKANLLLLQAQKKYKN